MPARLAPLPFAVSIVAVYALSFASQVLLAQPTTGAFGVFPFVLVQAALIGAWIVLHRRRLRDAGRPAGIAIGIASVYALEVVLLALSISLLLASTAGTGEGAGPHSTILQLFVILYLLTLLTGDPTLGALQVWIFGILLILFLPVVIAVVFSIWTAMRPRAAPEP